MRRGSLTGTVLLLVAVIIVVVPWISQLEMDRYTIASTVMAVLIGVGAFLGGLGAILERKIFSIVGGGICLGAAVIYRLFIPYFGAWQNVDVWLIMGGAFMLLDSVIDRSILSVRLKTVFDWRNKRMKKPKDKDEELFERLGNLEDELEELWRSSANKKKLEAKLSEVKRVRTEVLQKADSQPELLERFRKETYKAKSVQTLLGVFLSLDESGLNPTVEGGDIIYKPAEEVLNVGSQYVRELLERLAEPEILVKKFEDKVLDCPKCSFHEETVVHYKCQKCASRDIEMIKLLEHLACGIVHEKTRYLKEGKYICPKCSIDVNPNALRTVGVTFKCNSCTATFSDPIEFVYCKHCGGEFSMKEAEFTNAYGYNSNPNLKEEIITSIYTSALVAILKDEGFTVEENCFIKGKSEQSLCFTLVARRKDSMLALDLIHIEKGVKLNDVLTSVAKFDDVTKAKPVLVALPSLTKEAINFLSVKGISTITGLELDNIKEEFKALLNSL